ncbi:MAG: Trm112 family protein [Longimicrobiales bacterium]
MHILLTDVLVCPRCGPAFGLILLADRIEERRVLEGRLGCPNCREQYPITGGTVDLSAGALMPSHEKANGAAADDGVRIAALLGVTQGPAYVLLIGDAARHAAGVRNALADVEVIALSPAAISDGDSNGDSHGLSRVIAARVPVTTGKMSGVALIGARSGELLEEAARAVRPTGRLLVDPAPADAATRLAPLGLRILAQEGPVLLAIRG